MVKHRNPFMVIVLLIITLTIYGLYWVYSTSDELIRLTNKNASALLWLVLALIPILNIIALWYHSQAVSEASRMGGEGGEGINGVLLFIIWLIFAPVAIFISQRELNRHASAS